MFYFSIDYILFFFQQVSSNLITSAKAYSKFYGPGGPKLDLIKKKRNKFSDEQIKNLETFLNDKANVTMRSVN